MSGHTAGEWWFNPDGDESSADPTVEGPNGPIASIHHITRVVGEGRECRVEYGHFEDGFLMAAAPDMRDALALGIAMRAAQNRYFKDRSQANLVASKAAEAAFDKAAKAALDKSDGAMQQGGLL
jgi:hypothetical protein